MKFEEAINIKNNVLKTSTKKKKNKKNINSGLTDQSKTAAMPK